jgi:SPP1 gp7 family putative phage head morphogenesis protein
MIYSPYVPSKTATLLNTSTKDASVKQWFNRRRFAAIRSTEFFYIRALKKLAHTVGQFINDLWSTNKVDQITPILENYSEIIEPWAFAVSQKVISQIAIQDEKAWLNQAGKMASTMQSELANVPLNEIVHNLRTEQVKLIKSIPVEAARRVQNLAFEAAVAGKDRREEIAKMISNSEHVTESRAMLIARTETTRAHSIIQQARAQWIGSENYIWKTLRDRKVRPDHQELEGQIFNWNEPPVADKKRDVRAHPGQIYNCRCFAIPILPSRYMINKRDVNY